MICPCIKMDCETIKENLNKCVNLIKYWLTLIVPCGLPFVLLGFDLFILPPNWSAILSSPVPIQLIWYSLVPFAVTILVWTAKQGERGKCYNNCYWAFVIVQSIGFLSFFAYVYAVLRPCPTDFTVQEIQTKPIAVLLLCLVGPLHLLAIGLAFGIHWLTLFRRNIPDVQPNQKPWKSIELWSFAILGCTSILYFCTCLSWIAVRDFSDNLKRFPQVPDLVLETLLPAIYIWFIIEIIVSIQERSFKFNFAVIFLLMKLSYIEMIAFHCSDFVLILICAVAIGHQWLSSVRIQLPNNDLSFIKKRIISLTRAAAAATPAIGAEVLDTVDSEDKTSQSTQTEEELLEAITSASSVTQATQTKGK